MKNKYSIKVGQHSFKIIHFDEIDSTNDYLINLAKYNEPEKTIVLADYQTAGRGRYSRKWVSKSGKNLLFSLLLRPALKVNQASIITNQAAVAIKDALFDLAGISATLKQPNDVLSCGKKICGILTESCSKGEMIDFVVIGVGVNLNSFPDKANIGYEATCVFQESSKRIEAISFLKKFLERFFCNF